MELKGQPKTIPIGQLSETVTGMHSMPLTPMGFHVEEMPRMVLCTGPDPESKSKGRREKKGRLGGKRVRGSNSYSELLIFTPSVSLMKN